MLKIFSIILIFVFGVALIPKISLLIFPDYFSYDVKRILELVLLFYVFVAILVSKNIREQWLNLWQQLGTFTQVLLLAFFIIGLLSALLAPNFIMAQLEISLYLGLVIFAGFIAIYVRDNNYEKKLLAIIVSALLLVELNYLFAKTSVFINPRFLDQFLVWIIPLALLPLGFIKSKLWRAIIYVLTIGAWILVWSTYAKGLILSFLMSLFLCSLIFRSKFWHWFKPQLLAIVISLVLSLSYFLLFGPHALSINISASLAPRLTLWHKALVLIMAHPLLGIGPMHFAYYPDNIFAHPHNSFLLVAAEWGIPALFILLLLFIRGIKNWLKVAAEGKGIKHIGLTVAFVAGCLYSLVSGVIVMPMSQIMMMIVIGWMLGLTLKPTTLNISYNAHIIMILLVLLVFAGTVIGVIPNLYNLYNHEWGWMLQHYQQHQHLMFNPRFWMQGWIR